MYARVSVERDTVLRRRLGDSPGSTGQIRVRKRGCLFQSTSRATGVCHRHFADALPLHAQNTDSVNIFQPYFWLVFDDPNVRKRLPEENAQVTLHVADLPRGDGNVGLEEMMRGLGLYTTDNKDLHHSSSNSSPPPTETDPSKNASDAPPEGYKTLDVRVEWARTSLFSSYPYTLIHLLIPSL
jgi:hypothetical protein